MATLCTLRGSDKDFRLVFREDEETPLDLRGFDLRAFEPHPLLAPNLTLMFEDAAAGAVVGRIEWDDNFRTGRVMSFRVQARGGDEDISTPVIMVEIQ